MLAQERLIVALDVDTAAEAQDIVAKLRPDVKYFKVGMQLYNAIGPEIVRLIREAGGEVFVDLKFHDIPNTVGKAAAVVTGLGTFMFNVHAAGGLKMMAAAAAAARERAAGLGTSCPLIIAVTVLTSFNQEDFSREVGVTGLIGEQVIKWSLLAKEAGLDGVVASPQEVRQIRENCGRDFKIITPGVRPAGAATNDQQRVMTPAEAIIAGSDYLVVGRPITSAFNPREAAQAILMEMEDALS